MDPCVTRADRTTCLLFRPAVSYTRLSEARRAAIQVPRRNARGVLVAVSRSVLSSSPVPYIAIPLPPQDDHHEAESKAVVSSYLPFVP